MKLVRLKAARAGYTLLEMALAVGIAAFLMYAIYSTTAMYYMGLETGRELSEQSQLVRAVTQKMRSDIRATFVTYKPMTQSQPAPSASGSASGAATAGSSSSSTGSTSSSSSSTATVQLMGEYDVPAGGVLGTDSVLTIVGFTFPGDLDFANSSWGGSRPPAGDLRMVRYWLATERNPGPDRKTGLMREKIARLPDPEVATDVSGLAVVEAMSEEVVSMTFRYFDGTDWLTAWDNQQTAPPQAIEVVLDMVLPQTARMAAAHASKNQRPGEESKPAGPAEIAETDPSKVKTFRLVVGLAQPNAPPVAAAAAAPSPAGGSGAATGGGTNSPAAAGGS